MNREQPQRIRGNKGPRRRDGSIEQAACNVKKSRRRGQERLQKVQLVARGKRCVPRGVCDERRCGGGGLRGGRRRLGGQALGAAAVSDRGMDQEDPQSRVDAGTRGGEHKHY